MDACQRCIGAWFEADLDRVNPDQVEKDPKTSLQEWLQQQRRPLPSYVVTEVTGPAHQQLFRVHCEVEGLLQPTEGTGSSRRDAEQIAAQRALELLNDL